MAATTVLSSFQTFAHCYFNWANQELYLLLLFLTLNSGEAVNHKFCDIFGSREEAG